MGLLPRNTTGSLTVGLAIAALCIASDSRAATSPDACDQLYEQRDEVRLAMESAYCYRTYLTRAESDPLVRKAIHQNIFQLLARVSEHAPKKTERASAASMGIEHADLVLRELPDSALGIYWRAAFLNFECAVKDEGRSIRFCLYDRKREITQLLQRTRNLEPSVHGHGADRMNGVLLREMPRLVGGNLNASEASLREAFESAPNFSANALEYARTLIVLNKNGDARALLTSLVESNCVTMNPHFALECREDQEKARELLRQF